MGFGVTLALLLPVAVHGRAQVITLLVVAVLLFLVVLFQPGRSSPEGGGGGGLGEGPRVVRRWASASSATASTSARVAVVRPS